MTNGQGGYWRSWLLGIFATLFSALVISAFYFRAYTITTLSEHEIKIKHIEQALDRLEKR